MANASLTTHRRKNLTPTFERFINLGNQAEADGDYVQCVSLVDVNGNPVSAGGPAAQSGVWQVTPTLTAVSTLALTSSTLGGAIERLRLQSTDPTSTAWAGASVQIDLWSAPPTWTNGDHAAWLPATGSASHIASFTGMFPSAVWGDGLATECTLTQGNYASVTATTVYWSVQALGGSGALGGSKALKLIAELN
jgi:hypothetical protein